jgi:RNA polymerase sigma-70 factor (ECF subfamily)
MSDSCGEHDYRWFERDFEPHGFAARLIRIKADQLIGRYGFTESDRDDIEQELRLRLLRRLASYDPTRGTREGFIACRIGNEVADVVKRRTAQVRDWRRTRSLSTPACDDDGPVDAASLLEDETESPERRDLAIALSEVLDRLPPRWRIVCERVPDTGVTEIAGDLGVDRRTVRRWLNALRERFRDAGLQDFL